VTDDDGTIESGHPSDRGPGVDRAPEQPPPARVPRLPLPGFGVAHPGAAPNPGQATEAGTTAGDGAVLPPDTAAAPSGPAQPATPGPADPPVPSGPAAQAQPDPALTRTAAAGPAAAMPGAPAPAPPPGPGTTAPPDGTTPPLDIDQIASQVYERIGDKMDHRPDTAQDTPPAEQAIMLRDKAPELYDLWLKIAQEKAATSNYVQRAPYEVPERLAQSGRPRALSAMIVVLAFCGYLASLGGPGPYIGGLIAILDLLVMLALFFGLRPDHLTESSRPRKRRLIRATY
jgi:hypothetical protein